MMMAAAAITGFVQFNSALDTFLRSTTLKVAANAKVFNHATLALVSLVGPLLGYFLSR